MCPNARPTGLPHPQRGLGLVAAIFVITIMALIAVGLTNLTVTSQQSYATDLQSTRAFMAAQSGLELELNRLMAPASYPALTAVGAACLADTPQPSPQSPYRFSGAGLSGCLASVSCQTASVAGASVLVHRVQSEGRCGSEVDLVVRRLSVVFKTPR